MSQAGAKRWEGGEALADAGRRVWAWAGRHRTLRRCLRFLRRHWLECVALASLIGLVVAVNPVALFGLYRRISVGPAVLMVPVVATAYVFRGLGWWIALRHLGVQVSPWRGVLVMIAGQTLIFMPTGDLARVALLQETGASGRDEGTLAGSVAYQELLFMTLLGLGVLPRVFAHPDVALLVLLMTALHVGVFLVLLWDRAYDWAVGLVERFRVLRRFDRQLRSLRPAFLAMLRPRNLLGTVACNAVAAVAMFLLFYLALRALGVTQVDPLGAAFVYGLAHILGGLSFLPGGVGSSEAISVVLLAGRGVPPADGAAAAVLFRAYNDLLMALLGVGAGLLLRRRRRPD
jgi:glycosyltransferase 2 family protein